MFLSNMDANDFLGNLLNFREICPATLDFSENQPTILATVPPAVLDHETSYHFHHV